MFKRACQGLLLGAAMMAATPALATSAVVPVKAGDKLTYSFGLDSGSVNSGSSFGNTRTFDETVKGYEINMTASAWTATKVGSGAVTANTQYTVTDANLGQWSGGGLGVINRNENGGGGNSHQVDNVNGTDFILLEFDRPVTLSTISTVSYRMDNTNGIDRDVAVSTVMPVRTVKTDVANVTTRKSNGSVVSTTPVSSTTVSDKADTGAELKSQVASAGTSSSGSTTVSQTSTTITKKVTTVTNNAPTVKAGDFIEKGQSYSSGNNGTIAGSVVLAATEVPASKTWLVGASFTNSDGKPDGFKLKNIVVSWVAVVPEPQTWAMMILGFGFVGCALRRQRRIAAAA